MRSPSRPFDVCLYTGKPCCYAECPRRIYEEVPERVKVVTVFERSRELFCSFSVRKSSARSQLFVLFPQPMQYYTNKAEVAAEHQDKH